MSLIPISDQQAQQMNPGQYAAQAAQLQPGVNLDTTKTNLAKDIVDKQQAQAPQQLKADLANKMTLGDAISKYTALKMSPNDIFKQYLSENTWGPNGTPAVPIEGANELTNLGINTDALGKVGDVSSFMDRWNARNAIKELQNTRDYFAQTKGSDIAGNKIGFNANSKAYENSRIVAGLHLSSLIPGSSTAEGTGNTLLNT